MDWMAGHRGVKQAVLADDAGGRAYLGTSPEPLVQPGRVGQLVSGRSERPQGQSRGHPARRADRARGPTGQRGRLGCRPSTRPRRGWSIHLALRSTARSRRFDSCRAAFHVHRPPAGQAVDLRHAPRWRTASRLAREELCPAHRGSGSRAGLLRRRRWSPFGWAPPPRTARLGHRDATNLISPPGSWRYAERYRRLDRSE